METQTENKQEWKQLQNKYLEEGLTKDEMHRWSELDEVLCLPGSLAHNRKLNEDKMNYLKSIAMQGGCVGSND